MLPHACLASCCMLAGHKRTKKRVNVAENCKYEICPKNLEKWRENCYYFIEEYKK